MSRKSKETNKALEEAISRLKEVQAIAEAVKQEEIKLIEDTRLEIENLVKARGLFCGAILGPGEIVSIVDLAFKSNEPVKMPFNLYFNE